MSQIQPSFDVVQDANLSTAQQVLAISTHVALVAVAVFALSQIAGSPLQIPDSSWILGLSISVVTPIVLTAFVFNFGSKEHSGAITVQFAIATAGFALAALAYTNVLSPLPLGIGAFVLAALSFGLVFTKKESPVVKLKNIELDPEDGILIKDTLFDPLHSNSVAHGFGIAIGIVKNITMKLGKLLSRITHHVNYGDTISSSDEEALGVLIHGINGHPSSFDRYFDTLSSSHPISLFQPFVRERGQCSLDKSVDPIYEQVLEWAQNHPNLPVVLIAVSNGTRIAGSLAVRLREAGIENPIQVNCIAGPLKGTKLMNQPPLPSILQRFWRKVAQKLYHPDAYTELSWESDRAEQLVQNMRKIAKTADTHFSFYTTLSESTIHPYRSACPYIEGASYYATWTEGHSSVVRTVHDVVMGEVKEFLRRAKTMS